MTIVNLYKITCTTCGMGAIANNLMAAERLAVDHVHVRGDHTVTVTGLDMLTQVYNMQTLGEA